MLVADGGHCYIAWTPRPEALPCSASARDQARKYAFDWRDEPLLHVEPGESFEIETWDASTGYFKTPADKAIPGKRPGFDRMPPLANPIAGPVFVEGAERGDAARRHDRGHPRRRLLLDRHRPAPRPAGRIDALARTFGRLHDEDFPPHAGPAAARPRDGTLHFSDKISWPITPFVGTLGVAPDREVTTSLDGQGEWGGNLDIRDVCPGNRILLPVHHPGALFYLGDVHASQGDTEFTGTAAETTADVRLRFEVIKGKKIPWMRIEKPDDLVAVHAGRPLEVAVETATMYLMDWLIAEYGFTPTDAYCLVSTCPDFRINVYQMCKIGKLSFVAGAELPKRYIVTS